MARKDVPDRLVVEAHRLWHTDKSVHGTVAKIRWPYDLLMEWTGQPMKVCYAAMERASSRGLLEYGVSLRTAWPTEKGLELLAATPTNGAKQ